MIARLGCIVTLQFARRVASLPYEAPPKIGVFWPASMFWHELSEANSEALVLLSVRTTAETWWHSIDETILPYARMALAPEWKEDRGLLDLLERFTGTKRWDDAATMMAAYERHNAKVRQTIPRHRLLECRAAGGWAPICRALGYTRAGYSVPLGQPEERMGPMIRLPGNSLTGQG